MDQLSTKDSERLDRLELDIKLMASSVSEIAVSMKQLIEMQTEQKLLKQEMENQWHAINNALAEIKVDKERVWEVIRKQDARLVSLKELALKNSWASSIVSRIGWTIAGAALTGLVGSIFILLNLR